MVHYLDRRVDHKYKQITLFETGFLIHGLGRCEGVGEDSGYELSRYIQVGSCICLNVCLFWSIALHLGGE